MTDDPNMAGSEPAEEPSTFNDLSASAMSVSGQLTAGERLIAIGALLILVVCWLLGTLILDDYSLANISVLLPIGILGAMYFYYSGPKKAWHPLYGTIVRVSAWAIAIIAVYGFIDDMIIASNRPDGAWLFYEITFWVAGALCAVGAWQIRSDDR
ncbi:MAG: hypothetical protein M5U23_05210 [Acidimicrobiia bacterium]|nr:hypothetical protein [Acidimicrobiia bacterium]